MHVQNLLFKHDRYFFVAIIFIIIIFQIMIMKISTYKILILFKNFLSKFFALEGI